MIDPGDESNTIMDYIESNNLKCKAIMLTHGHFDHVGAVNAVAEQTGCPVYINKRDEGYKVGMSGMMFKLPQRAANTMTTATLSPRPPALSSRSSQPGTHPGRREPYLRKTRFSGDTLFRGSCGRTDLPGGATETELRSVKKLCMLPGDYEVYPGHMDSSTLERERRFNHYCREAMANF